MLDCHELIVDEMHSKIEITNAVFDEYFTFYSHILIKFIKESDKKLVVNSTDIITWEEGVIDSSMKKIQFGYSHNIPVGCNKIKVCIINRKAVDYKISIAIGLL